MSTAKRVLYIWIGMVLSLTAAGIWISNTGSLKGIGGTEQVLDLSYWQLSKSNSSIRYDKAVDQYEILKNTASIKVKINKTDRSWNYLSVDIGDMSSPVLECTLVYYDEENKKCAEQRMELKQGHSLFALEKVQFSSLKMKIDGEKGTKLTDVSVQFRDELEFFSGKRYLAYSLICFGIYAIVIFGVTIFVRRGKCAGKSERLLDLSWLQNKYSIYVDLMGEKIAGSLSDKWRRRLRVLCLALLAGYLIVINNCGEKYVQEKYDLHMVIILGIFFLFICMCWEKKLKEVRWNKVLFISWGLTAILMTGSDFLITKEPMWTGVFILLFFGMFYFVWGNMKCPEHLTEDLCTAWNLVFWIGMLCCLLFRKIESGYLYSGFFSDSSAFALFLVIVAEIGIGRILEGKKFIISGIELGMSVIMIWKTQELFAFSVVMISSIVGLVMVIGKLWEDSSLNGCRQYVIGAVCAGVSGLLMWSIYQYVDSPLIFDMIFSQDSHQEMKADNLLALVRENNWKYFFYTKFMIWKQYIREWNLYGHAADAVYNGKRVLPYNGFFLMAYRYGIITLIPYVVMVAEGLCVCVKRIKEKRAGYYVCLFSGIGYILLNLIQNVEVPYVGLNWLWMALLFGYCFKE